MVVGGLETVYVVLVLFIKLLEISCLTLLLHGFIVMKLMLSEIVWKYGHLLMKQWYIWMSIFLKWSRIDDRNFTWFFMFQGSFFCSILIEDLYGGSIKCVWYHNIVNSGSKFYQLIATNNIFKLLAGGTSYGFLYILVSVCFLNLFTSKVCF